uniref:Senescence domain-containing protein n=1 Tax=Ascaris lumbricoides TaxID=6252 RepID=A0A0M3HYV5_ASCLU
MEWWEKRRGQESSCASTCGGTHGSQLGNARVVLIVVDRAIWATFEDISAPDWLTFLSVGKIASKTIAGFVAAATTRGVLDVKEHCEAASDVVAGAEDANGDAKTCSRRLKICAK